MINLWALLQKKQGRTNLEESIEKLKLLICEAYAISHGWAPATAGLWMGLDFLPVFVCL
jgi:hypothetical protein